MNLEANLNLELDTTHLKANDYKEKKKHIQNTYPQKKHYLILLIVVFKNTEGGIEPDSPVVMCDACIIDRKCWLFSLCILWSRSSWGQSAAASGDSVIGGQITGPWYALEPLHRNNKWLGNQKHITRKGRKKTGKRGPVIAEITLTTMWDPQLRPKKSNIWIIQHQNTYEWSIRYMRWDKLDFFYLKKLCPVVFIATDFGSFLHFFTCFTHLSY